MHCVPVEIAILHISDQDHDDLHRGAEDALKWVNEHKVFPKDVKSVVMLPHASTQVEKAGPKTEAVRLAMFMHYPPCGAQGSCLQI